MPDTDPDPNDALLRSFLGQEPVSPMGPPPGPPPVSDSIWSHLPGAVAETVQSLPSRGLGYLSGVVDLPTIPIRSAAEWFAEQLGLRPGGAGEASVDIARNFGPAPEQVQGRGQLPMGQAVGDILGVTEGAYAPEEKTIGRLLVGNVPGYGLLPQNVQDALVRGASQLAGGILEDPTAIAGLLGGAVAKSAVTKLAGLVDAGVAVAALPGFTVQGAEAFGKAKDELTAGNYAKATQYLLEGAGSLGLGALITHGLRESAAARERSGKTTPGAIAPVPEPPAVAAPAAAAPAGVLEPPAAPAAAVPPAAPPLSPGAEIASALPPAEPIRMVPRNAEEIADVVKAGMPADKLAETTSLLGLAQAVTEKAGDLTPIQRLTILRAFDEAMAKAPADSSTHDIGVVQAAKLQALNEPVTLYSGGPSGTFWTVDPERAASYAEGQPVKQVEVPRHIFEAGRTEAARLGQPTPWDTVLPNEWVKKAVDAPEIQAKVTEIDATEPVDQAELFASLGITEVQPPAGSLPPGPAPAGVEPPTAPAAMAAATPVAAAGVPPGAEPLPGAGAASGPGGTVGNLALKLEPGEVPPPRVPGEPPQAPSPYDDLTEPILRMAYHGEVLRATHDAMTAAGIPWDKQKFPVLSNQIASMVHDGTLPLRNLVDTLQARGLTVTHFVDALWRPAVTDAAKRLNELSQLAKQLDKMAKAQNVEGVVTDAVSELGTQLDGMALARGWWRRLDNVRRGLLVTQLSTSMRNVETQILRVTVGAITDSLDYGIQRALKAAGANIQVTAHPLDSFMIVGRAVASLTSLGRGKTARAMRETTGALLGKAEAGGFAEGLFPKKYHDRLFNVFASDIGALSHNQGIVLKGADKAFSKIERGVQWLNTVNRGQEWMFRNAVLVTRLDTELHAKGFGSLADTIQQHNALVSEMEHTNPNWKKDRRMVEAFQQDPRNLYSKVDPKMLDRSIDSALEMTFAETPKYGTVGYEVVRAVNRIPGLTLVLPFPRFMHNSLKFLWQYNPTGFLNLLSSSERARIAAGDTKVLSKAVVGTAMLYAAYQVRQSDDAGERWYEVNVPTSLSPGGKRRTVDIRPFNPFAAHFFVADVLLRWKENRLYQLTSADIATGLLSTNLRAGTGLAFLDNFVAQASSLGSGEEVKKSLGRFAGEYLSGFMTPLQVLADGYAQFDSEARIVRDRRQEPFTAPLKSRLPGGNEDLPPLELPTREGPAVSEYPLLKQLTGLLVSDPKNPLEAELQRLQFAPNEVFRGTRSPQADALVKRYMGAYAEEMGVDLVTSGEYLALSDGEKGLILADVLAMARKAARATAMAEDPELFLDLRKKSHRQRIYEESVLQENEGEMNSAGEPPGAPLAAEPPDED